jgi:hypothetical protein
MKAKRLTAEEIYAMMTPEDRTIVEQGRKALADLRTRQYLGYLFGSGRMPKRLNESDLSLDVLHDARAVLDALIAKVEARP